MNEKRMIKRLVIYAITALMFLGAFATVGNAAYIELGNPASTSYESYVPFYGYYDYSWSAVIYLQSELGGAKYLTALTYDVYFQQVYTIYDQKVWMKHTTATDWIGDLAKPDPIADGYTLVYEGDLTFNAAHWADTITLDTAFSYDGTDNLIIYWENWDGDYISGQPRWYYPGSSYAPNRVKYRYADGSMPGDATSASYYFPNIHIHFPTNNDVAVTDIVMPETAGYGNIPVHVEVSNVGLLAQSSFPVNVKINAPPLTLLEEGFEDCYDIRPNAPAGWLVRDENLDGYISGVYAYNMWGSYYSSSYANTGTMSMRMDYGGSGGDDDWLFMPAVTLNAGVTYTLDWYDRMSSSSTSYSNQLEVWIGNAQNPLGMTTNLWADPAMYHTTHRLDTTTFTVPTTGTYYIGFWRINGYSYSNMFIDDVHLYVPGSAIYDQTVTMTNLGPLTSVEANLPDWTVASSGNYEIVATTLLAGDENPLDDQMTQITQIGFYDASLISIDQPAPLVGPVPFHPVATVNNTGSMDFGVSTVQLPVHATVLDPSGGTGIVFTEDFEGATGFFEYDGEYDVEFNPEDVEAKSGDYVRAPGYIQWPDDEPQFGAPGDWTILNYDNNGAMWHQTDFRSASPDNSMYAGDENTKVYLPDSVDIMISPKIHVGTAGGSFNFNIYNDVEGAPYDYVVFGASPDGMVWGWWFGSSWWMTWYNSGAVPIYPTDVDANGDCYVAFAFFSDYSVEYEGVYIDDVEVTGSPYLYDETVYVDLAAGDETQVEFPLFEGLEGYEDFTIQICCESPFDSVPGNDCASLAFNNNAPIYNTRTGKGFGTIQAGIDDVDTIPGDTIKVQCGDYVEDITIWKDITVSGEPCCTNLDGVVVITGDGATFENFIVDPSAEFTTDQAAVAIYANGVTVRHNVVSIYGETNGTLKGIHAYATPSNFTEDIEISNNTVLNVKNGGGAGDDDDDDDDDFFFDFENSDGGWIPDTTVGDWEWTNTYDVANYVASGGYETSQIPPSTAHSGTGMWATVMYGPYSNSASYTTLTKTFDFSGLNNAELSFWSYENVFGDWDHCDLYVNGDHVWGPDWDSTSAYWKEILVDLSPYDGMSSVEIEFNMYATSVVAYAGWYLDDVEISGSTMANRATGGAVGIMVQGATWDVDVLDNEVVDVHSPGWSHGIEITPTALDPVEEHFQAELYFSEDFTGVSTGSIPTGWTKDPATTHWGAYSSSYSGGVSPEMRFYWSPSQTDDFYLITPVIDTTNFDELDFTFKHYCNDYNGDYSLRVVSLEGGNEHIIEEWDNPSGGWGATTELYTLTDVDHGVGAADFQLAWVYSGNSFNINYWYFDDVVLSGFYDYFETVYPWPKDVMVEGNYISRISKGAGYPEELGPPNYPGIELTIDYAILPQYGPTPADASEVTVLHNYFDPECYDPVLAILNMDLEHVLVAHNNWFGAPSGPGSFDPLNTSAMAIDPFTGEVADGFGSDIVVYGEVQFDKWIGLNAKGPTEYFAEAGQNIVFDVDGSWAKDLDGVYTPHYLWKFGDGYYSQSDIIGHSYASPGTYEGYLQLRGGNLEQYWQPECDLIDIPGWSNMMFVWNYFTVTVTAPGAPLGANAGGGSLSEYEVMTGEELTLSGSASGGTAPYMYTWNLGDGRTVQGQNPTVVYSLDEENPVTETYTLTLTVTDGEYNTATDTATVTVLAPGELLVTINAPKNAGVGSTVYFTGKATGGIGPYSYSWNFDDGVTSTLVKPYHIFENAGEYTVRFTVKDATGKEKTTTHTISIEGEPISGPEIKSVKGGLMVKATIVAGDSPVTWSMSVEGLTFMGGSASGTIPSNTQQTVKLPFTLGFGKADITVTAGTKTQQYTAFMLGPFFLGLEQA